MNNLSKNEALNILNSDILELLDHIKKINQARTKTITYSKNVFLDLTHICQNKCGYCTFKEEASETKTLLMNKKEVIQSVEESVKYNCKEALFTFGESADKNELISEKLKEYGFESMTGYVYDLSKHLLENYPILPHTNMGIISEDELALLSEVNVSMGLMLETTNKQLLKTIVHKNSPTKAPKKRLNYIENAGKLKIPFTTGLLVGIGESLEDRVNSLFEIRKLQDKYGHIQEIIIQNFTPTKGIPMENYPEPSIIEMIKLIILSSLLFPDVSIQVPPNLNEKVINFFILSGCDDLGGISPLTKDYINPESPWPKIDSLKKEVNNINYTLEERLPVYDKFINKKFMNKNLLNKTLNLKKRI